MKEHSMVTRRLVAVCVILLIILTAEFCVTEHLVDRDRVALQRSFAEDRLSQLDRAVGAAESELDGIAEDLVIANHLVAHPSMPRSSDKERLASALAMRPQYSRGFAVVAPDGTIESEVFDASLDQDAIVSLREMISTTGREATTRGAEEVAVSEHEVPGPDDRLLKAFSMKLESVDSRFGSREGAVVLVVDAGTVLSAVKVPSGDPHTSLLIASENGAPHPLSSRNVIRLTEKNGLDELFDAMERRESGTLRFATDADAVTANAIGAHGRVEFQDETVWKVATITSMNVLDERQRTTVWRLNVLSGVVALLLVAFGAQFVVASRREATLSERLEAAHEIAHVHERANRILADIPAGVMLLSSDDEVTQVNRSLADSHPIARSGRSLSEVFEGANEELEMLRDTIDRACDEETTAVTVRRDSTLFGDPRQLRISVIPLPSNPEAEKAAIVFDDFSELHTLKSQLLLAEKLATVGILAAGIAHEIGTPLGVIRGRAELLLKTTEQEETARDNLKTIIDQTDRISEVINGVLEFSREKPPHAVPTRLDESVEKVRTLLQYETRRKETNVEVDIPEDLPPVRADPNQLQQVLINLLANALDASEEVDAVRIVARERRTERRPAVRFSIEDEGEGIPEEQIHQVFDPFFTTKKRGKGTGLGLPIVAQIVRSHGGEIDIRSRLGRGTTVFVTWPAVDQQRGDTR